MKSSPLARVFWTTAVALCFTGNAGAGEPRLTIQVQSEYVACPWDSTLRCGKALLRAGPAGVTLQTYIYEAGIVVFPLDFQFQFYKDGKWTEYAPVLATYAAPTGDLKMHKNAVWPTYFSISNAEQLGDVRNFRVSIRDSKGEWFQSSPFVIPIDPVEKQ